MLSGPAVGLCTRELGAGRPCFHRLPLALLDISETRKLYLKMTNCAVFVREERAQRGARVPRRTCTHHGGIPWPGGLGAKDTGFKVRQGPDPAPSALGGVCRPLPPGVGVEPGEESDETRVACPEPQHPVAL